MLRNWHIYKKNHNWFFEKSHYNARLTNFWRDQKGAITIEWVVITAGVVALGVASYGAFSVRSDKFDESEMRMLFRYKMEQYNAIPSDDYTIIERLIYSAKLQMTAFKGCIGFGVHAGQNQNGEDVYFGERPSDIFCNWADR